MLGSSGTRVERGRGAINIASAAIDAELVPSWLLRPHCPPFTCHENRWSPSPACGLSLLCCYPPRVPDNLGEEWGKKQEVKCYAAFAGQLARASTGWIELHPFAKKRYSLFSRCWRAEVGWGWKERQHLLTWSHSCGLSKIFQGHWFTHSCFSTVALMSVRNTRAVVGGRGSDGFTV